MKPVDVAQIYYQDEYRLSEKIIIHQPTVKEVIEYGEMKFWGFVSRFCANTVSLRVPLWDIGIDWTKISDFEMFSKYLVSSFNIDETKMIFGNIDFTKFRTVEFEENDDNENKVQKTVLVNISDPSIIIDEEMYETIMSYLRTMFDYHPKTDLAKVKGKATKEAIIMDEKGAARLAEINRKDKKTEASESLLLPLLSYALNHPGFKYRKDELDQVGIFEFMDAIRRLQNTTSTEALWHGVYSGMLDTKDMNLNKELNLTRNLYE